MNRFFVLLVASLFAGCMEEERVSVAKLQASEIEPVDSGGQDLVALDPDIGTDTTIAADEIDTADAVEVAGQDASDAEVGNDTVDTADAVSEDVEVAGADEVSSSTDVAMDDVPEVEGSDIVDAADSEDIAADATEIQESTDVPDGVAEDVDAASEIADDVSEVVDDVGGIDVVDAVDAVDVADGIVDTGQDIVADIEQDIPPDAPPDTAVPDVEVDVPAPDVPPPDPCLTLNCDDKNPCTADSCDKVVGCSNAPTAAACEDGDACTVGDLCALGNCSAGVVKKCNDGNLCTTDSCDPKIGCVFANNALPCEDGDICTVGEICGNGACVAGQAKNCSDGNVCTSDVCDQVKGCVNAPMAGSCDDGNVCTDKDVCSAGVCLSGAAKTCDDGNACTSNVCDAVLGCVNAPNWVVYDYKDATLTTEWSLTGDMGVICNNGYTSTLFKQQCVIRLPQGAPAWTTSTAVLDLDWVRSVYKMGSGDVLISYLWARFQFEVNQDVMSSSVLDGTGKSLSSVVLEGTEGTTKAQTFTVGLAGKKLEFKVVLNQYPLKTGPAAWGKVLIAPVGCTPP